MITMTHELTDEQLKFLLPNGCKGKLCSECPLYIENETCNFLVRCI